MTRDSRPPAYATARLDSLMCPVLVDVRDLEACLPAHAELSLPRMPGVPPGQHCIFVEVWRVHEGLLQFGPLNAHNLWELGGSVAGMGAGAGAGATLGSGIGGAAGAANGGALGMWLGPWGWWWGASTGAAAGAAFGAAMLASAGAVSGARWAAAAGRRTSENYSRVMGTYNEILVTVPCRRERHGRVDDFLFVLTTYTDSPASILGEWLLGWGYGKSRAVGELTADGSLEVTAGSSGAPFRIVWKPCNDSADSAASGIPPEFSRPLLGVLPGNRLMQSFLDRSFDEEGVQVRPATVELSAGDNFIPGLRGFSAPSSASALLITGLPVTLSYPQPPAA